SDADAATRKRAIRAGRFAKIAEATAKGARARALCPVCNAGSRASLRIRADARARAYCAFDWPLRHVHALRYRSSARGTGAAEAAPRSEEHTSELQSRENLV